MSGVAPVYDRDGITVYHADCRDLLPSLPADGAIVTDPPYGIGYVHSGKGAKPAGRWGTNRRHAGPIAGDDEPFDPSHLLGFNPVLMWGANHYAARLPAGGRWLAWDKLAGMDVADSFGDVDFAWHNRPGASRIISYAWKGVASVKAGESNGRRWHPSQKPIGVMKWSIDQAGVAVDGLVIDPYAGSGSTGVACAKMGRRCILVESDARYIPTIINRLQSTETPLFNLGATP